MKIETVLKFHIGRLSSAVTLKQLAALCLTALLASCGDSSNTADNEEAAVPLLGAALAADELQTVPIQQTLPLQQLTPEVQTPVSVSIPEQITVQQPQQLPLQTTTPVQPTTPIQLTTPEQETTPVQGTTPIQVTIPVLETTPEQEAITEQETTPVQETTHVQETTLAQETTPVQETTSAQETPSAQETAPEQETVTEQEPATTESSDIGGQQPVTETATESSRFMPVPGMTWQWQLQGTLNTSYNADVYGIDLFDNSTSMIADLQAQGRNVICYFSAGTYEAWRSDAESLIESVRGENLGDWPGERWLDIRSPIVRGVMLARLDLAKSKGCDAVEPDNVDVHTQASGFEVSYDDMLGYNRYLANAAHDRGLSIALKNNTGQVDDLVSDYDFAMNESCFRFNECDKLQPFIDQNKAVLQVEYIYESASLEFWLYCANALNQGFSPIGLPQSLDDSFRLSCQ